MYCHVFAFEIERLQATAIKGTDKKNIENLNFQNIINAQLSNNISDILWRSVKLKSNQSII
jgi:hypothetical protein